MFLLLLSINLGDVSSSIGVNIHFTGAPARDLDLIRDAGFGWIRMDFAWSAIEREKGVYRFDEYDALLDGLSARGIKALFILDYSHPLYEKDRSVQTEEGRKAFAKFAGTAAARYRGRGVRWEVWNEPNLEGFWKPQPGADAYAALVIEASKAIRVADPQAKILAPASSGFPWGFLERIFEKGILDCVDEVSVHPYRSVPPETVRGDYARLRELIAKYMGPGRKAPPIVSGEWGYSTWHYGGKPMTPELQGMYLAREFLANLAEEIPLSIWYDWANDGPDPEETEHNFGTVTLDRQPKPAYVAVRTLTSVLGKATFERRLRTPPDKHLLLFSGAGRRFLAAWTREAPDRIRLYLKGPDGRLPATDYLGVKSTVELIRGTVELSIDGGPRYVELPAGVEDLTAYTVDLIPVEGGVLVSAGRSGPGPTATRLEATIGGSAKEAVLEFGDALEASTNLVFAWPPVERVSMGARLLEAGTQRTLATIRDRVYMDTGLFRTLAVDREPEGFSALLDGDASVAGEVRLSVVAPEGEPRGIGTKALRLDYRFGQGWKFASVVPPASPKMGPGILSVWVKGDGSGNWLRLRFTDSKGETFQPTAGQLSWKGWRHLEIPLDGTSAGSWGGDGKVDYPTHWSSLFLVDSAREVLEGRVEFAAPVLILPGT